MPRVPGKEDPVPVGTVSKGKERTYTRTIFTDTGTRWRIVRLLKKKKKKRGSIPKGGIYSFGHLLSGEKGDWASLEMGKRKKRRLFGTASKGRTLCFLFNLLRGEGGTSPRISKKGREEKKR